MVVYASNGKWVNSVPLEHVEDHHLRFCDTDTGNLHIAQMGDTVSSPCHISRFRVCFFYCKSGEVSAVCFEPEASS